MPDLESRSHFFGVAAHLMRQILVDHARKHNSEKRGGGAAKVALEDALGFAPERSSSMIALDDAAQPTRQIDARQAKVIELRFFRADQRGGDGPGAGGLGGNHRARTTAGGGLAASRDRGKAEG